MALLLDIAPLIPPVSPTDTGADVYARFQQEPDTMAIAVVDRHGHPIGLVERNAFLSAMAAQHGYAVWAQRPVARLMSDDALIVDGDITVEEFCGRVLDERPSGLMHGFIVTCAGRYAGVGTMFGLLQASAQQAAAQAAEMQRLAEAANAALASRSRFLAIMSHEIRTPLNGVLGVAEILKAKAADPEAAPLVDTILDSGAVLMRLLNDALDFCRSDASTLELREEPLAIPDLVRDALALWSPQAQTKGVVLSADYDGPEDLWVMGDPVRLRQVLNNLLSNALKFTAVGTVRLELRASIDAECVKLCAYVIDSGPGIRPDRLESIFDPFHQTEEGARLGGAGLGLAVCRQIIERMGGRIAAHNKPHGGASFRFEVPLYPTCVGSGDEAVEDTEPWDEKPLHVLIVDDNSTNRLVASQLCGTFGFTSECVEEGAAAVEAAVRGGFDLILMDIMMPGMDGVDATRAIRAAGLSTPILALTANADPADAASYLAAGMNGVVEKPLQAARLLAAMHGALEGTLAEPVDAPRACLVA